MDCRLSIGCQTPPDVMVFNVDFHVLFIASALFMSGGMILRYGER